jgi:catechol 2,3-dioxygenase-like lactoylglutathione lyase family enzyme
MPLRRRTTWWGVVLDAPDPMALAEFYRDLLGWELLPGDDGWASVAPAENPGHYIAVQHEPDYVRPVWPAEPGEQQMSLHLDFEVEDLDEAVAFAESLGAVQAEFQPQDDVRVMFDPAGHPFCLYLEKSPTA